MARRNLALNGAAMMERTIEQADYAREEINALGGYYAFGSEIIDGEYCCAFDTTKLSVHTRDIGLAGVEVYDLLRDEYDIQLEFGDIGNFLAIVTAGDRDLEIERLISALSEIKRLHSGDLTGMLDHEYINPLVEMTPQTAFYSDKVSLPIEESAGRISTESVMCYPPGIPILAPGERITDDILRYIAYAKEKGCFMTGTEDMISAGLTWSAKAVGWVQTERMMGLQAKELCLLKIIRTARVSPFGSTRRFIPIRAVSSRSISMIPPNSGGYWCWTAASC